MRRNISQFFIETDESDDVAGSIRHALVCLRLVRTDHSAWKWLILSLHSALQGACVCHLTTTASPVGALTKTNTIEWLSYFELSRGVSGVKAPKTHIAQLPELLKRVRKPGSAGSGESTMSIKISYAEFNNLRHLHSEVRNQFVHFEPMGWTLEVMGMQFIIPVVLRIIADILDAGWAFRHENIEQTEFLRDTISTTLLEADGLFLELGNGQP